MDATQYCSEVCAILDSHFDSISCRLHETAGRLPPRASSMTVGIHVDQDGEGFLTIRVHAAGPDLYVLNRALGESANLFQTKMTRGGFDPPMPLMSPDEEEFSVPHVLSDCATRWVESRWADFGVVGVSVPVYVGSMEDYGRLGQIMLSPGNVA